jgi:lipid-binding SYLF domain-containing protein
LTFPAEKLRVLLAGLSWLVLVLVLAQPVQADSKAVIDTKVQAAIATFQATSSEGAQLLGSAAGVLVFPDVIKMGFGIGGEYGEGSLLVDGDSVGYYSTGGASFGLQVGLQFKALIVLFMNDSVLAKFRRSKGWEVGVDGSIALATIGAGGAINSNTVHQPIMGFIFSNKGLMYNLTLEGSKINRLKR